VHLSTLRKDWTWAFANLQGKDQKAERLMAADDVSVLALLPSQQSNLSRHRREIACFAY
jgi:hypothetical protein